MNSKGVSVEKTQQNLNTRNVSYDLLRVCAAVMVVLLHVAASNWSVVSPNSASWGAMNLYDSLSRGAVPIFFMLSGAFLLRKDIELKELYTKKIIPMCVIWFIWAFLYAVDTIGLAKIGSTNFVEIVTPIIDSYYHLWFIPTLIGLYIMHPILRGIVSYKEGKYIRYIEIIFILFSIANSTIRAFIQNPLVILLIDKIPVELMSYSCYMIMGYYLANVSKRNYNPKKMLLIFGISALICASVGQIQSFYQGIACAPLYGDFSATSFLEAVSLFLFFKNTKWNYSINVRKTIYTLSSLTFGVYLIHPFVISQLELRLNLNTLAYNAFITVPVNTMITVGISFLITYIMGKIPIVKKIWIF